MARSLLSLVLFAIVLSPAAAQQPPDRSERQERLERRTPQDVVIDPKVISAIVETEVVIAEWDAGADKASLADLSGPAADVAKRVAEMEKQGKLTIVHRLRLATVDGQAALIQLGERRPRITASNAFGGGRGMTNSVSFENVGTMVNIIPHVHGEDAVTMKLTVEKSGPRLRADSPVIADSPVGEKVRAESIGTLSIQTVVRLASDKTAVVAGLTNADERYLVLVTAKVTK
jgi:type II secretory pathway component GspD/PulD (secretin)